MIQKAVAVGLLVVLIGIVALVIADLSKLRQDPEQYQRVYGFSGAETNWSHRSQLNYVLGSLLLVGFCLLGMLLAGWSLRSRRPLTLKALYLYVAFLAALVLLNLARWWQSGFDH